MAFWHFVGQFCREPRTIGAIAPSSKKLADKMIQPIDFEKARVIVEYGPGSGVFTRHVLNQIDRGKTIFFGLELNEKMNRLASEQAPEVTIYQDSAAEVRKYLKQYGFEHADAIISGLPWASFPESLQDEILSETVSGLPEGGVFTTFAYLHGLILPSGVRFRKKLLEHFSQVETSPVVWGNLPPALVYWCKK
ncbi:MAG: phosphatidylethanolamine/phosphatidyl-N-methylethanolamine N-methyltransferase [Clostridiales bacterium]|jgi:phospholipid N-methyltransferase|nr:phosphatidylethanolamine/phosphatidyl-N-methylethanolamine N-methyltransferase [Clostridiales bacterium]MDN5283101.1 phosphatidylethanolamine/phosphatidyl-N-methylethanolamine N-methyltransferase [Candidatus Ozemobacter sp.]